MKVLGGTVMGVAFLFALLMAIGLALTPSPAEKHAKLAAANPDLAAILRDNNDWNDCVLKSVNGVRRAHPYDYLHYVAQVCQVADQMAHTLNH